MSNQLAYNIYVNLYSVLSAVKLYHYQSLSYGHHKTCDWFYDEFLKLTDKLLESHQGKYGRMDNLGVNAALVFSPWKPEDYHIHLDNLVVELQGWKKFLDEEFQNILLDMIALVEQFRYLLSFN